MLIDSIRLKPGREWSIDDRDLFRAWLCEAETADKYVQFAFNFTQDLELAKQVVRAKSLEVYKYISHFEPAKYRGKKCPIENYLYYAIARGAMRAAQQAKKRQEREVELNEATVADPCSCRDNFDNDFTWARIEPYVQSLPEIYRDAVTAHIKDGLTHKEAAQRAGCELSAMKVRYHRGIEKLRKLAQEELSHEP
jgi:DNA-directed RNA polymerase specialized sigma24 family protein